MKTKKILAVALSVIMLLSSAPLGGLVGLDLSDAFNTQASAASYNGLTYTVSNGKVTITGCNDISIETLKIPSKIDGKPVTRIGNYAFATFFDLKNVEIPNSVTSIGDSAFYKCALQSITIPKSVTKIGNDAFAYCFEITNVKIPDSVKNIGKTSFFGCTGIEGFSVSEANRYYSSDDLGVLYNKNKTTLIHYPTGSSRKSFEIPKSVTKIDIYAFAFCQIKNFEIPDNVKVIDSGGFYRCGMKSIKIGNGLKEIGEFAFYCCEDLTDVYYCGTKKQWKVIEIEEDNDSLLDANIHFNCPKQVTGLKVSDIKTTSLKLTWSKTDGAKYYKVEQSTDGKKWKTLTTTDKTSYTVKSLKAGTKYQFRVTALDSTKKIAGKASSVLKTGTLTSAPSLTLKSTKSKTATASWKKVTGASKYVVYKSTNGKKWTKVTTTTKTSYTLKKLTGGKKIYVRVTALNAYGKASAYSSSKNVTVKK